MYSIREFPIVKKLAILVCRCLGDSYQDIPFDGAKALLDGYEADVFPVYDLCAAAFTHKTQLEEIDKNYESKIIFACHLRTVKNLFLQQKIRFQFNHNIDYRSLDAEGIQKNIDSFKMARGTQTFKDIRSTLNQPAWFPVIDRDRCSSCGRCAGFCVFGVYRMEQKKLIVQNPLNCKNNCPACARQCPESAIIFPKIAEDGVISGSDDFSASPISDKASSSGPKSLTIRSSIIKKSVLQKTQSAYDEAKKSFHDGSEIKHD
jgi:NAD-dependent dihydropyrimidine dehydrogenase PreA subunit